MTRRRYNSQFFPQSSPLAVQGGVKARSARGAIGTSWWSGRFIEVLEGIGVGSRLARGKNYARRGQVMSLKVDAGTVTASVQGSRSKPYRVRIGLAAFGKSEWASVEESLANNAWYVASLLAGEMPDDIEEVFTSVGLSLFPRGANELSMDCSCPDWEVPCKHLAAVFYLLAEQFDEDPFRILAWRGRERDDLLGRLREADAGSGHDSRAGAALTDVLDAFFESPAALPLRPGTRGSALLVDQLPEVDLTVRSHPLAEVLRPVYTALRESGPEM
ncbi:SWIM zinc finger family protein [Paeniglutamicibacter psychrophenolicus]|uniref:Zn finger protein n=1 Tax=Paeniglutamicibacter psychrophenolicus TaxID=257454 RepID=A0ABS4WG46_9MICC|nr:SWIM zinc finger family protein [Paeniglutamicibacter psychrophenolicus]MBP2375180.1 putative Zn finger protein [Paeniglutamicibacter psychrophenolicus]